MITIDLNIEVSSTSEMSYALTEIARLIDNGYTNGVLGDGLTYWSIEGKEETEDELYFQPEHKVTGELPEELYSFQVFHSYDEAVLWLVNNGYKSTDFYIKDYQNDDIEDHNYVLS